MYVYMYTHMYACMCVCLYVCMYVCMSVCCMHACMHTCMYIRTYVRIKTPAVLGERAHVKPRAQDDDLVSGRAAERPDKNIQKSVPKHIYYITSLQRVLFENVPVEEDAATRDQVCG